MNEADMRDDFLLSAGYVELENDSDEPRRLHTDAGWELLGNLGGTEWDEVNRYESPTARMIRQIEETALRPGAELAEAMRELWSAADAREPLARLEQMAREAIAAYERDLANLRSAED